MEKTLNIGLIVAMTTEADFIESYMEKVQKKHIGAKDFTLGTIGKVNVIMVNSGVGKVNAAYATTLMIRTFSPDYIISTGVAGGLMKMAGNTVFIARRVVQHDIDTSPLGDPLGYISGVDRIYIDTDKNLSDIMADNNQLGSGFNFKSGTIATGDAFISDSARAEKISEYFGAEACDMESAAVGQVAYMEGIPFAVLRTVSDDAGDNAARDYSEFLAQAAQINAQVVSSAISKLN